MLHFFYQLLERWGTDLWAERITHRYELDQVVLVSQMRGSDGGQITGQVGSPYRPRRLAQALGPASAPVSHREQDSMRRAHRSTLPTLGSNPILITGACS